MPAVDPWTFEDALEQVHSDAGQPLVLGAYNSVVDYNLTRQLVIREAYTSEDIDSLIKHFASLSYLSPGFTVAKAFLVAIKSSAPALTHEKIT